MATEKKTAATLGVLALGYFLLRKGSTPAAAAAGGDAPTPTGDSTATTTKKDGGGGDGALGVLKKLPGAVKTGAAVVTTVATATGLSTAVAGGAILLEAAGIGLGYEQDGVLGAVVGGLNPIVGNAGLLGANVLGAGAKAAGLNGGGVAASEGSGAVLGGIVALGDVAAAAVLLPTVGIVIGLGELFGSLFGGSPSSPPLSPLQQVYYCFQLAKGALTIPYEPAAQMAELRVQCAAQLVAWANGPDQIVKEEFGVQLPPVPNDYKPAARLDCLALGLGSLIGVGTAPTHH